jgi:diaminopimelate epimerase
MNIPFTKAHGAHNDFLLTWRDQLLSSFDAAAAAVAICDRHTGAGADGWLLVSNAADADGAIELWNSDGSRSEISGNGTRCAAAFLIEANRAAENVCILTGAGVKHLRMLDRNGRSFSFEMNMAKPRRGARASILDHDATILNVGTRSAPFRERLRWTGVPSAQLHRTQSAISPAHKRLIHPSNRRTYARRPLL